MVKSIFVVFGLICSFAFTTCYVVTVPDDSDSKNVFYEPNIEDFGVPIEFETNKLKESRPKDEFEIIEPEQVEPVYQAIPELPTIPTFLEDIPYYPAVAGYDLPEDEYAVSFHSSAPQSDGFDLYALMPSISNDKDLSLPTLGGSFGSPSLYDGFEPFFISDEWKPSMINGMESSFPRLQDDVLEDALGAALVKLWMVQYCTIHPECDIESLKAELAKME